MFIFTTFMLFRASAQNLLPTTGIDRSRVRATGYGGATAKFPQFPIWKACHVQPMYLDSLRNGEKPLALQRVSLQANALCRALASAVNTWLPRWQ